jgi:ABC-type bacteriocin/lantibiotic exporter with double-glycine peptidase domain
MNKKILIKQHDITDCGAACLASVAAFYKPQKKYFRGIFLSDTKL